MIVDKQPLPLAATMTATGGGVHKPLHQSASQAAMTPTTIGSHNNRTTTQLQLSGGGGGGTSLSPIHSQSIANIDTSIIAVTPISNDADRSSSSQQPTSSIQPKDNSTFGEPSPSSTQASHDSSQESSVEMADYVPLQPQLRHQSTKRQSKSDYGVGFGVGVGVGDAPLVDNAKCSCGEHQGKEMLSQVFNNISVVYLFECIFGHTAFCKKYWESRKFSNIKVGDWKRIDAYPMRQLEYNVDLGGTLGKPKNIEDQV
jgi:hypothetical protein